MSSDVPMGGSLNVEVASETSNPPDLSPRSNPEEGSKSSATPTNTPRLGRQRSTAVRYTSKQAADDSMYLLKANRQPVAEEAFSTEAGIHGIVVSIQGWRKTMEDAHFLAVRSPTSHCLSLAVGSLARSPQADVSSPLSPQLQMHPVVDALPLESPFEAILGVYDGHQNDVTAKYLQERLHSHVITGLARLDFEAEVDSLQPQVADAMKTAFVDADEEHRAQEVSHGGSTVGLAVVCTKYIVLAMVGDCKAAVIRGDGTRVDISVEHRLAVNAEEKLRVEATGTATTNDRVGGILGITRAIGDYKLKPNDVEPSNRPIVPYPEVALVPRTAADEFVVVGCDGVWELQTLDTVQSALRSAGEDLSVNSVVNIVHSCCSTTVAHHAGASAQEGTDNVTLGVLRFYRDD